MQRFQKTYEALEAESVQEKKQLTELHQQRVQSELNEKTRVALDDYMEAIDDNNDVSACVLRVLCVTCSNDCCTWLQYSAFCSSRQLLRVVLL